MTTNEQDIDEPLIDEVTWGYLVHYAPRLLRSCGYATISALLVSTIDYGIRGEGAIIGAIGLLGMFTSSARIGQVGMLILLTMALISPEVVQRFFPH